MKNINYKEVAKVFNSKCLAALADGDSSLLVYVSKRLFLESKIKDYPIFFNRVFAELNKNYRSEYVFKNFLVNRRLLGRHSLATSTMLSEFRVGANKADCVILNGKSTCYEIKTEYDSITRLNDQVSQYKKLFDEVYVVCSEKNLSEVASNCPPEVGVLILSGRSYFKVERKASWRTGLVDREALFKSLRKDEYQELTEKLVGYLPRVPNGRMFSECKRVVMQADEGELVAHYQRLLKKHRSLEKSLINVFPESLKNAAVSYQFTSKQENRLISIFGN